MCPMSILVVGTIAFYSSVVRDNNLEREETLRVSAMLTYDR